MDLYGVSQKIKDDSLFLGVMDFLAPCGELLLASSVDDVGLSAKTQSRSGRVHGNVSAAHDDRFFRSHDRCSGLIAERLHKIASCQIFIGREHAHCLLAGDSHELGKACAGADEYGLIALILHKIVDRSGFADDTVRLYFDTEGLDVLDLFLNYRILGKTELGNAVHQNAACLMQSFENSDFITHLGQITRAGEAGRA